MNNFTSTHPIMIVGGGPVGLFLGYCLTKKGLSCRILEKNPKPVDHSRSLGIHPVSLALFNRLGLAESFIKQGRKIYNGIAYSDHRKLGVLSFKTCPGPYRFILTLPQWSTEGILEAELNKLDASILQRNAEVTDIARQEDSVQIRWKQNGAIHTSRTEYLVGCDGKDSLVRMKAGIPFEGYAYPDTYIMGDFTDNTTIGSDAAIFLSRDGVVESLPFSENMRRWVIKTERFVRQVNRREIEKQVARRLGINLSDEKHTMVSCFGVQRLMANTFAEGPYLLAGDSAHIVSPIGGQGMNLGWLDAWDAAETLHRIHTQAGSGKDHLLKRYSDRRRNIALKVIRRAEFNMRLGRKRRYPVFRNSFVWLMINTPLSRIMARFFTMHGLEKGII